MTIVAWQHINEPKSQEIYLHEKNSWRLVLDIKYDFKMSYDYSAALTSLRDARRKRGKIIVTKKFFDTLKVVNQTLPLSSFYKDFTVVPPYACICHDKYSNELLREHVHGDIVNGRVAKTVTGNDNCLFNAVSVALIGK